MRGITGACKDAFYMSQRCQQVLQAYRIYRGKITASNCTVHPRFILNGGQLLLVDSEPVLVV
jgi:hypothetical protein